ncbi:MAG: hypothetical protein Q4C12_07145 [Clostridia bacterium]|nr:hypothetical protein [Clostridia bacterium]
MANTAKRIITFLLLIALVCTSVYVSAQGGDENDPLVAKSYLDTSVIPYLEGLISSSQESLTFTVVSLSAGQTVTCAQGCEIILRMGSANVFSTEKGGIADVTIGGDWPNGSAVPANHHLIVPLADGRGITAATDCIVMIKGKYEIN